MSWYVRYLLLNAEEIKESVLNSSIGSFTSSPLTADDQELVYSDSDDMSDFIVRDSSESLEDNDFFNDLLIIERKIKELHGKKILTSKDLDLIDSMKNDPKQSDLGTPLGDGRFSISDRFNLVCNLLSNSLGGLFTNSGYVEHLTEKYNLNDTKKEILKQFIENDGKI